MVVVGAVVVVVVVDDGVLSSRDRCPRVVTGCWRRMD